MTVKEVLDRRHAVLRDRWQTAEGLGLFDVVVAADLIEQMSVLADLYRALATETAPDRRRKGKTT